MLVDQECEGLCIGLGESQSLRDVQCDAAADFAVVFDMALAQVMQQQCQMQEPLVLDLAVRAANRTVVVEEVRGPLHGEQGVLVDGVLMVLVELQQTADMRPLRDYAFQQFEIVQQTQHFCQPGRLRQQRAKMRPRRVRPVNR